MPTKSPLSNTSAKPRTLKTTFVAGGAAGVLTCPTGTLAVGDEVISVARFTTASFAPGTDLSAEFLSAMGGTGTVTTADRISNLAGTATTGQLLLVTYATRDTRA